MISDFRHELIEVSLGVDVRAFLGYRTFHHKYDDDQCKNHDGE